MGVTRCYSSRHSYAHLPEAYPRFSVFHHSTAISMSSSMDQGTASNDSCHEGLGTKPAEASILSASTVDPVQWLKYYFQFQFPGSKLRIIAISQILIYIWTSPSPKLTSGKSFHLHV